MFAAFSALVFVLKSLAIIVVSYGGILAGLSIIVACFAIACYLEPPTFGRRE